MSLTTGQILNNRYRVVKLLAQGGFGAIYRAWDINLNKACALKENLESTPQAQKQFEREATILSKLNHPHLVRVTDHFFIPNQGQYLVMDYVEGEDLQEMLDRTGQPLPEAQVIGWLSQICDALAYLHWQNPAIIHRDIKPANIKITPQGRAMLVDFGIAKLYDPLQKTTLGARAVTPGYSPPEQYGNAPTDARSDVYALSATVYALLTAREPAESPQRISGVTLPLPRSLNPAISPHVERAILRGMELQPGQRFQTAADLRAALTRPSSTLAVPTLRPQFVWLAVAIIAAMLMIGGLVAGVSTLTSTDRDALGKLIR